MNRGSGRAQQAQRQRRDAIVIGAGLMGASTAWALAQRGRSVEVLERLTPANASGSSHGSARIVRRAYPDALFTRLTGRSLELWRELELQAGVDLLRMLGAIDFGPAREIDAISKSLRANGVANELLSATEAAARWPGMVFDGEIVFHREAGTVDAELAVQALLAEAQRHGAVLRTGAEVQQISPTQAGVEIRLSSGEPLWADAVVIAAGAWQSSLLDGLIELPELTVTQQQIFHFPRRDRDTEPWPSVIDQGAMIYHLAGGRDGGPGDDRKIAEHRHGTVTTASGRTGVIDPRSRQRLIEYVSRRLPGLEPKPGREATCLYTRTASEDFALDRIGRLVVCSACSGHGAKFAPLIGELAADLVTDPERAAIPDRFRLAGHRG